MHRIVGIIALCSAASLAVVGSAHSAVQVNSKDPIQLQVFVPCANNGAGELVDLSGDLHTLISATINGNKASGSEDFQPQGINGVGETTGAKYHAVGGTRTSFDVSLQNGQGNQTFVNTFDIIGQGPGNNLKVQEVAHVTFNADGTITVLFDKLSVTCK